MTKSAAVMAIELQIKDYIARRQRDLTLVLYADASGIWTEESITALQRMTDYPDPDEDAQQ